MTYTTLQALTVSIRNRRVIYSRSHSDDTVITSVLVLLVLKVNMYLYISSHYVSHLICRVEDADGQLRCPEIYDLDTYVSILQLLIMNGF